MRKRELEKLLYQAVADALGVETTDKQDAADGNRRADARRDHDERVAA